MVCFIFSVRGIILLLIMREDRGSWYHDTVEDLCLGGRFGEIGLRGLFLLCISEGRTRGCFSYLLVFCLDNK